VEGKIIESKDQASFEGNKKYELVLEVARELFWKYGFKRVSIEEVVRKANISKMTFYRYFPNKTELARKVFDQVVSKGLEDFREIMESDSTPQQKIHRFIMMKSEGTNDISAEFLADFYENPQLGLKEYIEDRTRNAWKEIIADFKKAQQKGTFRADFKPELLIWLSQRVQAIVSDKQMLQLYDNPQSMVMDVANLLVFGIASREVKK
jgi:AcrR family transcriptional regulator